MDKELEKDIRSLTRSNTVVAIYATLIGLGCLGAVFGALYLAYLLSSSV